MSVLQPNFRLWIFNPDREGTWGDGKMRLLEAIERCGSLQRAAKNLGISYRKAWGDLKKAEECVGVQLIIKERGGKGGGRTSLTADCKRMMESYSLLRTEMEERLQSSFAKFERQWGPQRKSSARNLEEIDNVGKK